MRLFQRHLLWLFLLIPALGMAERGVLINPIDSEPRIALVIGNSSYETAPLANPVNDAHDIAQALTQKGFLVSKLVDASQSQMRRAIRKFGMQIQKGGVGLFFYAGHGMQVNGINYLIPIGADIQVEDEVQDYAVDAGMVLRKMQSAGNRINMVFLDACRNNPFARSFRGSQTGLAQMDAPAGSLISYATAPGKTASDGTGRNGTFTKHLLSQLDTNASQELIQLMKQIGKGVQNETEKKQVPWISSSITGDFFFTRPHSSVQQALNPTQPNIDRVKINVEEEFWLAIKDSSSAEDFASYIGTYPNGRFHTIALLKKRQLSQVNSLGRDLVHINFDNSTAKLGQILHPIKNRGVVRTNNSFGKATQSAYFDGASFLEVNDNNALDLGVRDYTISIWIKPEARDNKYHTILEKGGNKNLDYLLTIKDGRILFYSNNFKTKLASGTQLQTANWHHVVVTHSVASNRTKLYINGELEDSKTTQGKPISNNWNLFIGYRQFWQREYFIGAMDELLISSKSHTGEEIKSHFIQNQ